MVWFNKSMYVDSLRRLRLAGLVFLALCLVITLLPLFLSAGSAHLHDVDELAPVLGVYLFIGPLVLIFNAFSFQFRRNASDLYHALPMTRTCLYTTLAAAAMTWVVGTIFATLALAYLCLVILGYPVVTAFILPQIITYSLGALLVGACALIGISSTGTRFSAFVVTGLVLFLPRCISVLCALVLGYTAPLLVASDMGILFNYQLNIPVAIFLGGGSSVTGYFSGGGAANGGFFSVAAYLYTLVLTLVYLVFGAFLFNRRASETAEKAAPSKLMQHVYRCLFAMPTLLIIAIIFATRGYYGGISSAVIILFVVTLAIYLLYELITTKRFRNLPGALLVFPIPLILSFGIVFGSVALGRVQMANIPQAGDIASIQINQAAKDDSLYGYGYGANPTYRSLLISELRFSDEELIGIAAESLQYSYNSYQSKGDAYYNQDGELIRFNRASGGLTRRISVLPSKYTRFYELIQSSAAYREATAALPLNSEIYRLSTPYKDTAFSAGGEEAALFNLYRQEYEGLSIEERLYGALGSGTAGSTVIGGIRFYDAPPAINFTFMIDGIHNSRKFHSTYIVDAQTPLVAAAAMRYANSKEQKDIETMREQLRTPDNISWANVSLQLCNIPAAGYGASSSDWLSYSLGFSDGTPGAISESSGELNLSQYTELVGLLAENISPDVDITRPFVQFNVQLDAYDGNDYTGVYTGTLYAPLDDGTIGRLLSLIASESPDAGPAQASFKK